MDLTALQSPMGDERLTRIYQARFTDEDLAFKQASWNLICRTKLQRYVRDSDTVLDLGAGTCEFIKAIRCAHKIAIDLNPEVVNFAGDATAIVSSSTDMREVQSGSVDVVFSSNFLEHLPDKEAVLKTFEECHRVLRPDGTIVIVMPNIRYLPGRYWDYFDHYTPLTHHSVAEALTISGFTPVRVTPKFLPYTVKHTRLPRSLVAFRVYLRVPLLWRILGKQMLVVARRTS